MKKGEKHGLCNRQACLKLGATWYNRGTQAYYCEECALWINQVNPDIQPPLCSREVEVGK